MAMTLADDFPASCPNEQRKPQAKFTYRYGFHENGWEKTWQLTAVDGHPVMTRPVQEQHSKLGSDVTKLPVDNSWRRPRKVKRFGNNSPLRFTSYVPRGDIKSPNSEGSGNFKDKLKSRKFKYLHVYDFDKCKNRHFVRKGWSDACGSSVGSDSDSSVVSPLCERPPPEHNPPGESAGEHWNIVKVRHTNSRPTKTCEFVNNHLTDTDCDTNCIPSKAESNIITNINRLRRRPGRPSLNPNLQRSATNTNHRTKLQLNGIFAYVSDNTNVDQLMNSRPIVILERISATKSTNNWWKSERPNHNMSVVNPTKVVENMADDIEEIKQNISSHELGEFPMDLTKYSLGSPDKLFDVDGPISVTMSKLRKACSALADRQESVTRDDVLRSFNSDEQQLNTGEPEYVYFDEGVDTDVFSFNEAFGMNEDFNENSHIARDSMTMPSNLTLGESNECPVQGKLVSNTNKSSSEQSDSGVNTGESDLDPKDEARMKHGPNQGQVPFTGDTSGPTSMTGCEGPPILDKCTVFSVLSADDQLPNSPPVIDDSSSETGRPSSHQENKVLKHEDNTRRSSPSVPDVTPVVGADRNSSSEGISDGTKENISVGEEKDTDASPVKTSAHLPGTDTQIETGVSRGMSDSVTEERPASQRDFYTPSLSDYQMDVETDEPYPVSVVVVSMEEIPGNMTQTFTQSSQAVPERKHLKQPTEHCDEPYDLSCDENRKDSFMGVASADTHSILRDGYHFHSVSSNREQPETLLSSPDLDAFERMTNGLSDDEVFPRLVIAEDDSNTGSPSHTGSDLVIKNVVSLHNADESFLTEQGYSYEDFDNLVKPEHQTTDYFTAEDTLDPDKISLQPPDGVNDTAHTENIETVLDMTSIPEKDLAKTEPRDSPVPPNPEGTLKCVLSKEYDSGDQIRYVIRSLSSADSDESPLFLSAREEDDNDQISTPEPKMKPDDVSQKHSVDACYVTREQALLTCSALAEVVLVSDKEKSPEPESKDNAKAQALTVKRLKANRKHMKSRERISHAKIRNNLSASQNKFKPTSKRKRLISSTLKQFNTRSKARSLMMKPSSSCEHTPSLNGPIKARLKKLHPHVEEGSDLSSDLSDLEAGDHTNKQRDKKKKRERKVNTKHLEKMRKALKELEQDERTAGDDLPEILPPKRRRIHRKQIVETEQMRENEVGSRLSQEFPKHNWLENKYKQYDQKIDDESTATHEHQGGSTSLETTTKQGASGMAANQGDSGMAVDQGGSGKAVNQGDSGMAVNQGDSAMAVNQDGSGVAANYGGSRVAAIQVGSSVSTNQSDRRVSSDHGSCGSASNNDIFVASTNKDCSNPVRVDGSSSLGVSLTVVVSSNQSCSSSVNGSSKKNEPSSLEGTSANKECSSIQDGLSNPDVSQKLDGSSNPCSVKTDGSPNCEDAECHNLKISTHEDVQAVTPVVKEVAVASDNDLRIIEQRIEEENPEVLHALQEKPVVVRASVSTKQDDSTSNSSNPPESTKHWMPVVNCKQGPSPSTSSNNNSDGLERSIQETLEGMIEARMREGIDNHQHKAAAPVDLTLAPHEADPEKPEESAENLADGTYFEKMTNFWRLGAGNFTHRGQQPRNVKHTTPVQRVQPQIKNAQDTSENTRSQAEADLKNIKSQIHSIDESGSNQAAQAEEEEQIETVASNNDASTSSAQGPACIPTIHVIQPAAPPRPTSAHTIHRPTPMIAQKPPAAVGQKFRPILPSGPVPTAIQPALVATSSSQPVTVVQAKALTPQAQPGPRPEVPQGPPAGGSTESRPRPPGSGVIRHMTPDAFMREYHKMKREYQRIEAMLSIKEREMKQLYLMKDRMGILIQKMEIKLRGLPVNCSQRPQSGPAPSNTTANAPKAADRPGSGPPPAHVQEPFTRAVQKLPHLRSAHSHKSSTVPRHLIFMDKKADKSGNVSSDKPAEDARPPAAHSQNVDTTDTAAKGCPSRKDGAQSLAWKRQSTSNPSANNNSNTAVRQPSQEAQKTKAPIEIIDLTYDGPGYQKESPGAESGVTTPVESTIHPGMEGRTNEPNEVIEQRVQELLHDVHSKRSMHDRRQLPLKLGPMYQKPYSEASHTVVQSRVDSDPNIATRGPPALVPIPNNTPPNASAAQGAVIRPGEPLRSSAETGRPSFPGQPVQSPSRTFNSISKGVQLPVGYNPPYANHSVGDTTRLRNPMEVGADSAHPPPNKTAPLSQAQTHYFYAQVKSMQENGARKGYNASLPSPTGNTMPRYTTPNTTVHSTQSRTTTSNGTYQQNVQVPRDRPVAFYPVMPGAQPVEQPVTRPPIHGPPVSQQQSRDPTRRPSFPGNAIHTVEAQGPSAAVATGAAIDAQRRMRKRGLDRYPVDRRHPPMPPAIPGAPGQYYRTQSPMIPVDTRAQNPMLSPRMVYPDQRPQELYMPYPSDVMPGVVQISPRAQMVPRGPAPPVGPYTEPAASVHGPDVASYRRGELAAQHRMMQSTMSMPRMPLRPGHPSSAMVIPPQTHPVGQYPMQMPTMMQIDGRNGRELPTVYPADRLCVVCNQRAAFLCSGCKRMWYCSERCQTKSWQQSHKLECPAAMV